MAHLLQKNRAHLFSYRARSPLLSVLHHWIYESSGYSPCFSACRPHLLLPQPPMVIARECSNRADLNFQGKHIGETFQFQFHQHWIRLLGPLLRLLTSTVIVFAIGYSVFGFAPVEDDLTRHLVLSFLTALFIASQFDFLFRLYRYLLYVVVVTDKKVHRIKKTLITTDDHISVDLWMTQDIQKCQNGILPNILGFGSIIMEVQETILRFHYVPRILKKYEKLISIREEARGKMGYIGGRLRREARTDEYLRREVLV